MAAQNLEGSSGGSLTSRSEHGRTRLTGRDVRKAGLGLKGHHSHSRTTRDDETQPEALQERVRRIECYHLQNVNSLNWDMIGVMSLRGKTVDYCANKKGNVTEKTRLVINVSVMDLRKRLAAGAGGQLGRGAWKRCC